ncbi:unnamed protein product [Paramecium octaurelia]|uniref:asparagine--tRNA ligase n=1 Tax=Paramecium octaurelia TaxID=43137 RepID=A0A8S1V3S7_PAROT|nr:unnamed protein product [Paramecium octaurelia]
MQYQFLESDELYTSVKTLTNVAKQAAAAVQKQAKKTEKLIGEIEKPINVPSLPAGFKVDVPHFDVTKRLNKLPRSWELPQELYKKHLPKYNVGTIYRIQELLNAGEGYIGQTVTVAGWARTVRDQKNLCFIELNDGTSFGGIQIVVEDKIGNFEQVAKTNTGFSLKVTGSIVKSPAKGQLIEMLVADPTKHEVVIIGQADPEEYPMAKGVQKPETLRQKAHLRPRGNFFSAVTRIRNNLAYATHVFFQNNGCLYIHTPIITGSDCEGAGEMFRISTIFDNDVSKIPQINGKVDTAQDFFKKEVNLTVSGQLQVEHFCISMSNVYTFGPTFRAEKAHTHRHLAEFWMIEPEFAFADLFDNMEAAEGYVKFCINYILQNNIDDLQFLDKRVKPGLIDYLKDIVSKDFVRCSYTQGIDILLKAQQAGAKFENSDIKWGMDLNSEHERFIAEKVFQRPVFLYDYPKEIKAFYMKVTDDGKCVRAMDMLIPQVGELIGGSQREERYDVLAQRIKECGLKLEDYGPYMDLRKYGTVPHCGFGLGFERLVMMVTGVENIRDVIPFPRYHGSAEF